MRYKDNSPERDFARPGPLRRSYVVCSVPRCGSTLLCRVLWASGVAGAPHEYLNPVHVRDWLERGESIETFGHYLADVMRQRTGPNGVFALNAHYFQVADCLPDTDLAEHLGPLRYVYVRRQDRLRQAISWYRAHVSGCYSSEDPAPEHEPPFSRPQILRFHDRIQSEEAAWERYFTRWNVSPLRLTYEQLALDLPAACDAVAAHIGVEAPRAGWPPADLQRMSDAVSERWLEWLRAQPPAREPLA